MIKEWMKVEEGEMLIDTFLRNLAVKGKSG